MVARIKLPVRRPRHLFQRNVDRDRHHFERRAAQHHDRMQRLSLRRGESGEIFGMSRKGETRPIKHGLGDWVGDDGGCRARCRARATARSIDCVISGCGRRVGPPGDDGSRARDRQHRQRLAGTGRGRARLARFRQWARQGRARGRARRERRRRRPGRKAESASCASAPPKRASVMSGPIPAGSPRVSAKGRWPSCSHGASASTKYAPQRYSMNASGPDVAQQPLGAKRHFLGHQLALSLLAGGVVARNERLPQTA